MYTLLFSTYLIIIVVISCKLILNYELTILGNCIFIFESVKNIILKVGARFNELYLIMSLVGDLGVIQQS
jgi:hypothetical protein